MRTTVKILSIFAAAACAVGLSACEDEVMQQGTGAPAAEAAAGQQDQQSGGEQGAGATDLIGARPIEPITFNDETVGLTETCDAIHSDYAAPSYKAQASDPAETVYLLHCTLDFSGGSSFGPETDRSLTLIDDGNVAVRVTAVTDTDVITKVEVPGYVSNHKGLNLPGVAVSVPALSEKDREDLRWALKIGADLIALSFVRDADDIKDVHEIMDEVGVRIPVIAKIEKPQAVENLFDIVSTFDGIMVARGDLGVEMPLEAVPLVQKRAIELARRQAKPVIVATQVLESMIQNPRPTRAEASDCANAILDGADAVMLSGETSVGAYPIEAVRTMASIIENVEEHGGERIPGLGSYPQTRGGALTRAAAEMGEHLDVTYLVTFTQSGDTARRLSRLRSPLPLLAFTPLHETRNQLAVSWGVQCYEVPEVEHTDDMVAQVDEILQDKHLAQPGDTVVIVAGMPPGTPGSTNSIRVHTVGETGDYKI